jgi:phosphoglycerol transferase MdoB-like AlkP superfamily enzyme
MVTGSLAKCVAAAGNACARVLDCLPALALSWLVLRVAELGHGHPGGSSFAALALPALFNDGLALVRHGFVLMLSALPLLLAPSARWQVRLLGIAWTVLLCVQAALVQYHWVAGVPLGADLFGYSLDEMRTTVAGGWSIDPVLAVVLVVAIAVLWAGLRARADGARKLPTPRTTSIAFVLSVAACAILPGRVTPSVINGEAAANAIANKTAYFVDASMVHIAQQQWPGAVGDSVQWLGQDPAHPFAHPDRTPDTLGSLFATRRGAPPPNLVFIVVEGLGRSFSGPGARLGSFTPFLDQLAARGLYWENFLAGQGRTFGVLPTLFGSLPFGDNGFAALGARMPRHDSLLSVLKAQGYHTRFYSGSDVGFDGEAAFLRSEGVDLVVGQQDYGPEYRRANEWGYADRDLVEMALRREAAAPPGPSVAVLQTTTMHNPFTFPGRDAYIKRVGERLAQLGIARDKDPGYAAQAEIFASVLYTDDALRAFFERAEKLPGYANTIFIVTGDHRLPELEMETRIERYHVPLIVYSPLLKAPRSIKAMSSQFDVAPALLAFLSHQYGLRAPASAAWLGTGLDTQQAFRNLHVVPLKQTKTELSDFVSGTTYLAQDKAFKLGDGLRLGRLDDTAAQATATAQFRAFLRANAQLAKADALVAGGPQLSAYDPSARTLASVPIASDAAEVAVADLRRTAQPRALEMEALFTNQSNRRSVLFAPLLVLSDANGNELLETTGKARQLDAGAGQKITLQLDPARLPRGVYYLSMLPSDPETGHASGIGQYHVQVRW